MAQAFIAIGSNLKDRVANCRMGISEISRLPNTSLKNCSSFYETEPTGVDSNTPWFINGVIEITTSLEPKILLQELLSIEKKFGRVREPDRITPRTLDLDLLLIDDQIIKTEDLTIPHPRMHLRKFVLVPFAEISPTTIHPILKKSIKVLLDEVEDNSKIKKILN